jgi:hypothetical protein
MTKKSRLLKFKRLPREAPRGAKPIEIKAPLLIMFENDDGSICIGTIRTAERENFFDVITILPCDDTEPTQRAQGDALATACVAYIKSDDADPAGYMDRLAVLPFDGSDYISRELKQTTISP